MASTLAGDYAETGDTLVQLDGSLHIIVGGLIALLASGLLIASGSFWPILGGVALGGASIVGVFYLLTSASARRTVGVYEVASNLLR